MNENYKHLTYYHDSNKTSKQGFVDMVVKSLINVGMNIFTQLIIDRISKESNKYSTGLA